MPISNPEFDVAIVGAGVLGCGTARALLLARPGLKVVVVEKEPGVARHQSGRNSGVVHAGYNQKPGTRKAQYVVEGNRRLKAFCRERGVACEEHGILILGQNDTEVEVLSELNSRADANGAKVEMLDRNDVAKREPFAVAKAGLLAPEAASFDAKGYVTALYDEAVSNGAEFRFQTVVCGLDVGSGCARLETNRGPISAKLVVCTGGLFADRLARMSGAKLEVQIVPFRGYYAQLVHEAREKVRGHIYPCPDLNFPFLGVHLSRTWDGRVLVGPGAALALGREAYSFWSADARDMGEMARFAGFRRLWRRPEFVQLLKSEWRKSISMAAVAEEARRMVPSLEDGHLEPGPSGIRAQVVDRDGRLVDDLMTAETPHGLHVLNAVSPALTCSLPFCDALAARAVERLDGDPPRE